MEDNRLSELETRTDALADEARKLHEALKESEKKLQENEEKFDEDEFKRLQENLKNLNKQKNEINKKQTNYDKNIDLIHEKALVENELYDKIAKYRKRFEEKEEKDRDFAVIKTGHTGLGLDKDKEVERLLNEFERETGIKLKKDEYVVLIESAEDFDGEIYNLIKIELTETYFQRLLDKARKETSKYASKTTTSEYEELEKLKDELENIDKLINENTIKLDELKKQKRSISSLKSSVTKKENKFNEKLSELKESAEELNIEKDKNKVYDFESLEELEARINTLENALNDSFDSKLQEELVKCLSIRNEYYELLCFIREYNIKVESTQNIIINLESDNLRIENEINKLNSLNNINGLDNYKNSLERQVERNNKKIERNKVLLNDYLKTLELIYGNSLVPALSSGIDKEEIDDDRKRISEICSHMSIRLIADIMNNANLDDIEKEAGEDDKTYESGDAGKTLQIEDKGGPDVMTQEVFDEQRRKSIEDGKTLLSGLESLDNTQGKVFQIEDKNGPDVMTHEIFEEEKRKLKELTQSLLSDLDEYERQESQEQSLRDEANKLLSEIDEKEAQITPVDETTTIRQTAETLLKELDKLDQNNNNKEVKLTSEETKNNKKEADKKEVDKKQTQENKEKDHILVVPFDEMGKLPEDYDVVYTDLKSDLSLSDIDSITVSLPSDELSEDDVKDVINGGLNASDNLTEGDLENAISSGLDEAFEPEINNIKVSPKFSEDIKNGQRFSVIGAFRNFKNKISNFIVAHIEPSDYRKKM